MQCPQLFRADGRGSGEPLLKGGKYLHPFDGIDSEVRVESHLHLQHLDGITGLLTHHCEQALAGPFHCSVRDNGHLNLLRLKYAREAALFENNFVEQFILYIRTWGC